MTAPEAEGGEQQATADLLLGAVHLNESSELSNGAVDDHVEGAEVIQLAELFLRILHRQKVRRLIRTSDHVPWRC